MKTFIVSIFILAVFGLAGCSTTQKTGGTDTANTKPGPETVLVTYHVLLGREAELQTVLSRAWETYRKQDMVLARPHVIVKQTEEGGQTRFVEIFTWVKPPNDPPAGVRTLWQQEHSLCEARNGHNDIEGGPVELIAGK